MSSDRATLDAALARILAAALIAELRTEDHTAPINDKPGPAARRHPRASRSRDDGLALAGG
jgi:hypothetical protein